MCKGLEVGHLYRWERLSEAVRARGQMWRQEVWRRSPRFWTELRRLG